MTNSETRPMIFHILTTFCLVLLYSSISFSQVRDFEAYYQELVQAGQAPRGGYQLPLPLESVDFEFLSDAGLPIESVGTAVMDKPPYHATISYIGEHDGKHLMLTSLHVGDKLPHTATFNQLKGRQRISFPLDSNLMFKSVVADSAIIMVDEGKLTNEMRNQLKEMRPLNLAREEEMSRMTRALNNEVPTFSLGRSFYPSLTENENLDPYLPDEVRALYRDAKDEALANRRPVDPTIEMPEGFIHRNEGDIYTIGFPTILANGESRETRDPDGLKKGQIATPFLAVSTDWRVDSVAVNEISFPRNSGKPTLILIDGKVYIRSLNWTAPVIDNPDHVNPDDFLDPRKVFGKIEVDDGKLVLIERSNAGGIDADAFRILEEMKSSITLSENRASESKISAEHIGPLAALLQSAGYSESELKVTSGVRIDRGQQGVTLQCRAIF